MSDEEQEPTTLSEVLDQLEQLVDGDTVTIDQMVQQMGSHSFASLMLIFALISTSPASAIPGITTLVALIEFVLVAQIILGREVAWLPSFISRKGLSSEKLCEGIRWLRRPVRFIEKFLKPRLHILLVRPWIYLPLSLILALTLFMPLMEVIPLSGSIASAVIAAFAAGMLTRDGLLVALSLLLLAAVPVAAGYFGFSAHGR
ncbi:hypothetical protein FHS85_004612 [Rhodoligotrophos appendicifer]|uniref:exopolysaccharide biosynthesis protein n=1 Tax=Rhodoligotrophos appendicifer TaxID=987056 RepID=UPI00118560B9|nr:exopolysaccharide biosynthesis protein [Rhodoligotrophos appendicifer]